MSENIAANDAAAAMERLQKILREMHPQAAEIVTGQVAIERELRRILPNRFANPDRLPNLSTAHVLALLGASTAEPSVLLVLDAARAFTDMRNAVAHADQAPGPKKAIHKLLNSMERIGPCPNPETVRYGTVALAIVAALHLAFGENANPAA